MENTMNDTATTDESLANGATSEGKLKRLQHAAEEKLGDAKHLASKAGGEIMKFIKARPTESFVGAIALGFIVGRLVSRK